MFLVLLSSALAAPHTTLLPSSTLNDADATWTLPGNVAYPTLALNTADLRPEQIARAIHVGLANGITNVDFHLNFEADGIVAALKEIERSKLFLVTKLDKPPADMTDPAEAAALASSKRALRRGRSHGSLAHARALTIES